MGDPQVRSHYDELSAAYDRERQSQFFARALARYLDLLGVPPGRVLEVGCGTGGYLAALRGRGIEAYGVDFSPRMCESARAKLAALGLDGEALVACADAEETTGFGLRFDAIALMDSWEFFPHPERVLATAHRALAPGGRLIVFTPNQHARWLLTALEALRIKKLRPAFLYRQSRVARIRAVAGGSFRLARGGTLFFGLERYLLFYREP